MNNVSNSAFGDDAVQSKSLNNDIRCSSTGEQSTQYLDPATQYFEGSGNRSLASMLPGRNAVVIPRANFLGGPTGFDPHKPRLVNIDPHIEGGSCVVDLSKITKETMKKTYESIIKDPTVQQDPNSIATKIFNKLAISHKPVGMEAKQSNIRRLPPTPSFGTYVTPRSLSSGGQITEQSQQPQIGNSATLMSPSVAPYNYVEAVPTQNDNTDDNMEEINEQIDSSNTPAFQDQTPKQQPSKAYPKIVQSNNCKTPNISVTFEMEGWGKFEAAYHGVIKNECVLVLIWDSNFKGGIKFFPPVTDKLMAIKIGNVADVYFVNSYGTKFQHNNYEYCLLIIDQESEVQGEQS